MFVQQIKYAWHVDHAVHEAHSLGVRLVVYVWNQPLGAVSGVEKEVVKELVLGVDDHVTDLVGLAVQEGHQL